MVAPLIELHDLSCERGDRQLFQGLSLAIAAGDIVQVCGPNGSGKTSLLRILSQVSNDYGGEIRWQGKPLSENRLDYSNHLCVIGHLPGIKRTLTAAENLHWYSSLNAGHQQIAIGDALAEVGLAGYEDVTCDRLSAGQHRRVALARLFLTPARVWILDEPFTAIDVEGVARLEQRLEEHAQGGGVVIFTTHQAPNLKNVKQLNLLDFYKVSDDFE